MTAFKDKRLTITQTARLLNYNTSYFSNRRNSREGFGPECVLMDGRVLFYAQTVLDWANYTGRDINEGELHDIKRFCSDTETESTEPINVRNGNLLNTIVLEQANIVQSMKIINESITQLANK